MLYFFQHKINTELLNLAKITYGGEYYYDLKNYKQKDLSLTYSKFTKIEDALLKLKGDSNFFSYKNENSGFTANLFENIKTKDLVIAYRGTERIGLGENFSNLIALKKDLKTDFNLMLANFDEQFYDAYEFYHLVKSQNPKAKITLIGQSLGGALAQLVGAKLYSEHRQRIKTYTYNAPGCRHLLKIFDCDSKPSYSFVKNYVVMNDWCGTFGEKIGKTYLIPPIPTKKIRMGSLSKILENIVLTAHEGIFKYNGPVINKPKNFNQSEGMALWFYDPNNPIKEFSTPCNLIKTLYTPIKNSENILKTNFNLVTIEREKTLSNTSQFQKIKHRIQDSANDFMRMYTPKFIEHFGNNTFDQVVEVLDTTFSQVSVDTLDSALKILKQKNINKTHPKYYNSLIRYVKQHKK